mmetsp:Transcript_11617/g.31502  ORF Transcript_11617/g.31502 Transcript_11617/m.31502 type:complete len:255 (-) Transcript_11617:803-1567(-)
MSGAKPEVHGPAWQQELAPIPPKHAQASPNRIRRLVEELVDKDVVVRDAPGVQQPPGRSACRARVLRVGVDLGCNLPVSGPAMELAGRIQGDDLVHVLRPLLLQPITKLVLGRPRCAGHGLVRWHHIPALIGIRSQHDAAHRSDDAFGCEDLRCPSQLHAVDDGPPQARLPRGLYRPNQRSLPRQSVQRASSQACQDFFSALIATLQTAASLMSKLTKTGLSVCFHGVVVKGAAFHQGTAKQTETPRRHEVRGD